MASITSENIEDFLEFNPSEEHLSETGLVSGSGNYRINIRPDAISYRKKVIPVFDSETIREKIAFLIDCYTTFYEKLGNVEERLEIIEKQNMEILLFLSKEQSAVMASSTDTFTDINEEQMKAKIIEYYRSHPFVYPSDIAFEMNFDLRQVVKIINELLSSGEIEEAT